MEDFLREYAIPAIKALSVMVGFAALVVMIVIAVVWFTHYGNSQLICFSLAVIVLLAEAFWELFKYFRPRGR